MSPARRPPHTPASRLWRLALPALAFLCVFLLVPGSLAVITSFETPNPYGGASPPLTGAAYVRFVFDRDLDDSLIFDQTYLVIFLRSFAQAGLATLICALIALPFAWYIATRPPRLRRWLVLAVTLPFWTNLLIRIYCWMLLLRDNGLVNQWLGALGLGPLPLLYNDGAILLGLVYANLPFMVLPIYASLEKVDPRLIEAASDLYAGRTAILRHIVWPAARPGTIAGAILVFVPTLGAYVAPDLLGGGRHLMIGSLIAQQFSTSRNWPFGAALSMILMLVVILVLAWRGRRTRLEIGA